MVDGTGFKRRPDPEKNLNNKGELRVVIGIDRRAKPFRWALGLARVGNRSPRNWKPTLQAKNWPSNWAVMVNPAWPTAWRA